MGIVFYIVQLDYKNVSTIDIKLENTRVPFKKCDNCGHYGSSCNCDHRPDFKKEILKLNYSDCKPSAIFKVKLK